MQKYKQTGKTGEKYPVGISYTYKKKGELLFATEKKCNVWVSGRYGSVSH